MAVIRIENVFAGHRPAAEHTVTIASFTPVDRPGIHDARIVIVGEYVHQPGVTVRLFLDDDEARAFFEAWQAPALADVRGEGAPAAPPPKTTIIVQDQDEIDRVRRNANTRIPKPPKPKAKKEQTK